ncbi:MAG: Gfo/Idh/MocA family oxidoreductase [Armatimonadetes bacterium]|nr:Gfo/Idh/MocA family oxidoreductase [Armatimonadota bacterium]
MIQAREHRPAGEVPALSAEELRAALASADVAHRAATVVGYGYMGQQFVKALQILGVGRIRVCARSEEKLAGLRGMPGVTTLAGGVDRLDVTPEPEEVAIVATPTEILAAATERLVALGYRTLLIEKPVALYADRILRLADHLERHGAAAWCAYNRVAYPSFHEVRARVRQEGGITSCTYTFTEFIHRIDTAQFPREELARWGIANSLHVMSMAHGLIGLPARWSAHRAGSLPWHPAGAVFVGSGVSDRDVPFSYHADWGSTGRWSVEVHTPVSSYRLCPLEQALRRTSATGDWEEIAVATFASEVKVGVAEEVAAILSPDLGRFIPLVSLRDAAALTRYAESIFGYDAR